MLSWCLCHTIFTNDDDVDRKEEQAYMDPYTDEEEMEDGSLHDEIERHWRIFFKDNVGGVDDKKAILHAKKWDLYMNEKNC